MATQTPHQPFAGTPRFQILRRLGEGGMGIVYEALDRERDLRVAIKSLPTVTAPALLRLKKEFRALQDLHHPNCMGSIFFGQTKIFSKRFIVGYQVLKSL